MTVLIELILKRDYKKLNSGIMIVSSRQILLLVDDMESDLSQSYFPIK